MQKMTRSAGARHHILQVHETPHEKSKLVGSWRSIVEAFFLRVTSVETVCVRKEKKSV